MEILFLTETLKAVIKAGAVSPVFKENGEAWRSCEIDTDLIEKPDRALVVKTIEDSPKLRDLIENRRIVRKLKTLEEFEESEPGTAKIKRLEMLVDALKRVLQPTPHKWLFEEDGTFGVLLPYFVDDIEYIPARRRGEDYSPAQVNLKMFATRSGKEVSSSYQFRQEGMVGTVGEILQNAGLFLETEALVEEHRADAARFMKFGPMTGRQFSAKGIGSVGDSRWSRSTVTFEKDGRPGKVVMDDGDDGDDGDDDGEKDGSGFRNSTFWSKKRSSDVEDADEKAVKLPVHPILRVFDLATHEFARVHVSCLEPYKYDKTLGEKLVLPEEHRELIDALTGDAVRRMSDIIKGKATGVIILCSGKPGTGKTLTAEVYSEVAERPLYMVQCSQLGTDEEALEKELGTVLERAARWGAILLIDEADVYIHERGSDIRQNAIVGVFLRLLEYFNGILFLTTNRITIVDDAILSRITAHVKYDIARDPHERRKLWDVLSKQYGVEVDAEKADKEFGEISGRSIRQLIRLAKFMADQRKEPVTLKTLRWVARFHDFSEKD